MARKQAARSTTKQAPGPPAPPHRKEADGAGTDGIGGMGTAEYAAHAGVSDRTVRTYCRDGMPHARQTFTNKHGKAQDRIVITDRDAADAWRREHVGLSTLGGGKREGAGRPPKQKASRGRGSRQQASGSSEPRGGPSGRDGDDEHGDVGDGLDGKNAAELKRLLYIEKIREIQLKNELTEGKLVPRDEVKAAFADKVIRCRNQLAKLPESVARVAAQKLGLSRDQRDRLHEVLEQHTDAAMLQLGRVDQEQQASSHQGTKAPRQERAEATGKKPGGKKAKGKKKAGKP